VLPASKQESKNRRGEVNGYVVSLYKDWERLFRAEPQQVYLNVCFPGEWKGPHLHMRRWDYFATIRGSTCYVVKYGAGDYEEIDVNAADAVLIVEVPPAVPCLIVNTGDEDAWVINMPHPAWHPDDRDDHAVSYEDYPDWPRYASR
jgi:dTDP-4-dehydrorhamnose 3,5-epimerase